MGINATLIRQRVIQGLGVIGGTFDPIHNAHLHMAEEARARLNMAEVIFVPAGQPWLKVNTSVSKVEHRLEMVSLAIEEKPHFRLSMVEVDRPGPSYTVDTIAELKSQHDPRTEIFFILGMDSLAELPQWHEPSRLVEMCYLVAVPRPAYPPADLKSLEAFIPGISQRVILLDKPEEDISATVIRQRITRSQSVKHLVPEPVARYIEQHRLYLP